MQDFRRLRIWIYAQRLAAAVYEATEQIPERAREPLVEQMRRAALSIPSTIAEGAGRLGRRELIHFVSISMASAAELESQLLLARTVRLFPEERVTSLLGDVVSVRRMEAAFIKRLRQAERPRKPSKLEARHDADSSDAR